MGSYSLDSHATQLLEIHNGYMDYEGGYGTLATRATNPYQIPYESILPKEYDNFFVSVCVGASHVALASLRMEPQYMIMGEAAGCAAGLVARRKTTSAALTGEITAKLSSYKAVMAYTAAAKAADSVQPESLALRPTAEALESGQTTTLDPIY
jgi:hypothetical protein